MSSPIDSPWLEEKLQAVEDYRSAYQALHQSEIYASVQPVVLVTGSGADRVGRSVAKYFLSHGYRIVFHANHSVEQAAAMVDLCSAANVESMMVQGNVTEEATVATWVQQIVTRFGRLDAVIHCAATWQRKTLEETTAEDVRSNLDEHTLAAFLLAKHTGLAMAKQASGGSIVLIGDWSLDRPYRDFTAYFAGKSTIPTLCKSFAVELGTRNEKVRVNCILPGTVLLDKNASPPKIQSIKEITLLKRIGTPEDIAATAMFLCESPFITGVAITVDGGRHCYAGPAVDAIAHPEL